jgi:hypothetical protein
MSTEDRSSRPCLYAAFCEGENLALSQDAISGAMRYMLAVVAARSGRNAQVFGHIPGPYGVESVGLRFRRSFNTWQSSRSSLPLVSLWTIYSSRWGKQLQDVASQTREYVELTRHRFRSFSSTPLLSARPQGIVKQRRVPTVVIASS